ncbi:hypothetical protein KEM54_003132 [Ascosphaera aggregata]|nr:hypothetical protein KEM54_003132 [Ascosphaera aggregata]
MTVIYDHLYRSPNIHGHGHGHGHHIPHPSSSSSSSGLALDDKFNVIKEIGDGSFGSVVLARTRTAGSHIARRGSTVAIKTMKKTFDSFDACLELREVVFLRNLPPHAHLVPALDIFLDPISKKLHIAMEFMDGNLYQLMKARDHQLLDQKSVKSILFQIMSGLEHIHANGFFHRDIKPENILISTNGSGGGTSNTSSSLSSTAQGFAKYSQMITPPSTPSTHTVKIADFGLAREINSKQPYTTYVSTRWYRAPEVLLRAGEYSAPVDMWAVGAMAVEVATLKPLFPGRNEVDQVWRVCEIMGSPGNWYSKSGGRIGGGEWRDGVKLAGKLGFSFPKMAPHAMDTILTTPQWPASLANFVTWCLMWDPKNRPTAQQALSHEYFIDAIDPLRPKSSTSRLLGRRTSERGFRFGSSNNGGTMSSAASSATTSGHSGTSSVFGLGFGSHSNSGDSSPTAGCKPSWFRRSIIGTVSLSGNSSNTGLGRNGAASPGPVPVPAPASILQSQHDGSVAGASNPVTTNVTTGGPPGIVSARKASYMAYQQNADSSIAAPANVHLINSSIPSATVNGSVSSSTKASRLIKRATWTNGAAPMAIMPSIRPISPRSNAVTAQANAAGAQIGVETTVAGVGHVARGTNSDANAGRSGAVAAVGSGHAVVAHPRINAYHHAHAHSTSMTTSALTKKNAQATANMSLSASNTSITSSDKITSPTSKKIGLGRQASTTSNKTAAGEIIASVSAATSPSQTKAHRQEGVAANAASAAAGGYTTCSPAPASDNGNGGVFPAPAPAAVTSPKEGFFSHLRKRARRLSGRYNSSINNNSAAVHAAATAVAAQDEDAGGAGGTRSSRNSMTLDGASSVKSKSPDRMRFSMDVSPTPTATTAATKVTTISCPTGTATAKGAIMSANGGAGVTNLPASSEPGAHEQRQQQQSQSQLQGQGLMQSPNTICQQNQYPNQMQSPFINNPRSLSSDMTSRILEQLPLAPAPAAGAPGFRSGPVSSRTRRALQMSVSKYETPEEEDELMHDGIQAQPQPQQSQPEVTLRPRRTASYRYSNPLQSNLVEEPLQENAVSNYTLPKRYSNGSMNLAPGIMPTPQDLSNAFAPFQNPYPTPSPSARQELDFRAVNSTAGAPTPAMSNASSTTPSSISNFRSAAMASMSMSRGVGLGLATNGLIGLTEQEKVHASPMTSMSAQWRATPPYDDANGVAQ